MVPIGTTDAPGFHSGRVAAFVNRFCSGRCCLGESCRALLSSLPPVCRAGRSSVCCRACGSSLPRSLPSRRYHIGCSCDRCRVRESCDTVAKRNFTGGRAAFEPFKVGVAQCRPRHLPLTTELECFC
jgi:hypothetical protein